MSRLHSLLKSAPFLIHGLIGLLFIAAAIPKITDPAAFTVSVEAYRIVFCPYSLFIAWTLPWLELVCGVALLLPQTFRAATFLLQSLLIFFCLVLLSAWWRNLDISCGCFTSSKWDQSIPIALIRNFILIFFLAWATKKRILSKV